MSQTIYCIYCIDTNMIYIGKTKKTLEERWASHLSDYCRFVKCGGKSSTGRNFCTYLYRAMSKYGPGSFVIGAIDSTDSPEELSTLECKHIKECNSLAPNGYNLTTGGEGGWQHSPELKEQMRTNTIAGIHKNIDKLRKNSLSKGLPVHVCHTVTAKDGGMYLITGHPLCDRKQFKESDYETVEEAKEACLAFLATLVESGVKHKPPKAGNDLPRGIRLTENGGYEVKKMVNGKRHTKRFTQKSDEENLSEALAHLEYLSSLRSKAQAEDTETP